MYADRLAGVVVVGLTLTLLLLSEARPQGMPSIVGKGGVGKAGVGKAGLPPRPPIFLNNNASLYTFPNPNFGLPSQQPFAFVAVAHEDCRLYNNGATLMPMPRLLAAECQLALGGGAGGGGPAGGGMFNPFPFPGPIPGPPFQFQGMNFRRPFYPGFGYGVPIPTDPQRPNSTYSTESTNTVIAKTYAGFGSYSQSQFGHFRGLLQTDALTDFGKGLEISTGYVSPSGAAASDK